MIMSRSIDHARTRMRKPSYNRGCVYIGLDGGHVRLLAECHLAVVLELALETRHLALACTMEHTYCMHTRRFG